MNKQLSSLMQKEMTRKEFLAAIGLGIATLLGFGSLLRMLNGNKQQNGTGSYGYGSSSYGGGRS
jgi:hypothetical protein